MYIHKTTASTEQLASWLNKALQSATRGVATAATPSFKKLWEDEATSIRRAIDELKQGGSQTDIEEKKK